MYIFGESTLNNAVAIALCAAIENIKSKVREGYELDGVDIGIFSLETFVIFFFGSLLIGAGWAIFISFVIAQLDLDEIPWIDVGFFTLSCYFPYIFCEAIGCSGVLSIFICGMVMRTYAYNSLNIDSKVTIEYMVDTIALTTENFIFAYLGIWIPLMAKSINLYHVLIGLGAFILARPIGVFCVGFFINKFSKKEKNGKSMNHNFI